MLTKDQEKWINSLTSKTNKIKIVPYDPKTKEVFEKIKKEIQMALGEVDVFHHGATGMGISGQGEVDCFIPISENLFNEYLKKMIKHFGSAGSFYPLRRARFVKYIDEIKIEMFIINEKSFDWVNSLKFEDYLKNHVEALEAYKKLKEDCEGLSVSEYYRRKTEFINDILARC
ncbi:GrpB family protein [bacterium]|nr:GrpB family protein [bacterium]